MAIDVSPRFTVSLRGYDKDEVEHYLESVTARASQAEDQLYELTEQSHFLEEEHDRLTTRVEELENAIRSETPRSVSALGERITLILNQAEEGAADTQTQATATAEYLVGEAQKEAESLHRQASVSATQAAETLTAAQRQAEQLAERLEAEARARAGGILGDAELRAKHRQEQIESWAQEVIARTQAEQARLADEFAMIRRRHDAEVRGLLVERDDTIAAMRSLERALGRAIDRVPARLPGPAGVTGYETAAGALGGFVAMSSGSGTTGSGIGDGGTSDRAGPGATASTAGAATDARVSELHFFDPYALYIGAPGQGGSGQGRLDQRGSGQGATGQGAFGHGASEQGGLDKTAAHDHAATDQATTDQAALDCSAADPAATDRDTTDRAATDRAAADHSATDRAPSDHSADSAADGSTSGRAFDPDPSDRPAPERVASHDVVFDIAASEREIDAGPIDVSGSGFNESGERATGAESDIDVPDFLSAGSSLTHAGSAADRTPAVGTKRPSAASCFYDDPDATRSWAGNDGGEPADQAD